MRGRRPRGRAASLLRPSAASCGQPCANWGTCLREAAHEAHAETNGGDRRLAAGLVWCPPGVHTGLLGGEGVLWQCWGGCWVRGHHD